MMELDKAKAKVGEIIEVSIKINNINEFAGYNMNIKYDQNVLQPINSLTGAPYIRITKPDAGNILTNADYTPVIFADMI
jgi:hypothetical protein